MVSNEQRRRQLAREKFERQQERREAARRKTRRRNAVIAAALAVVVAAGATAFATGALSGDDGKKDTAADAAAPSATPSKGPDPCAKAAPGTPAAKTWKSEPAMTVGTSASYAAKLDTTCGTIDLTLDAAKAPHTVNSFNFLSGQGYFDHTTCHRLTTDPSQIFVLQCGDPKGTGMGDPGYRLKDENLKDPAVKDGVYPAGTLAMANAGPDTGGSQFFLVYKDSKLAPNFTPFGKVGPEGMKVLRKIAAAGEQRGVGDGPPNATVVVNKAAVTKS
ncbi:peptidylprolyl isomerase [Streptomyces eurocidicus]|uniref:Peptidyl-prolyl cis-trans isomerase n=1 Tax=Streptomyces eurocidicus TaxID=66423 RepID=A0A2N8NN45_STREU|nr:peptidylprolyl isomerase [Streptomyces eurocidicus]MBB5118150.1 peptidyl-prolyl cis-trans isomerase B (cyclophilin B) [Streptomyces eurocidicus]MBF6054528.1 peptidylprolyl isomerase [Streptomyces eurocidicus]PNE30193.1 peptidylprolyl isomerase [Streptomyces eurocidicus]